MHLLAIPNSVYRLGSYTLTQEALERELIRRHKLLGDWERLRQLRVPDLDIARVTSISRATYFRRKRAIAIPGTQGLARCSTRPKRVRQSAIPKSVRDLALMRRMSARRSADTAGRPGLLRRTFRVQNFRKALGCQPITVSGFKIPNAERHSAHMRESPIQKRRSALFNDRRFLAERCRTPI